MTRLLVRGKGAPDPRPIPTRYAGHLFRSRNEARWAVFFNMLNVRWQYEPEGYTDGRIRYLPDFWLPDFDCFWEVKPDDQYDMAKIDMLVKATGKTVYVAIGPPGISSSSNGHIPPGDSCFEDRSLGAFMHSPSWGWDCQHQWCQCPFCGRLGIEYLAAADRLGCGCFEGLRGVKTASPHTPDLHDAYTEACTRHMWDPPGS